MSRRGGIVFLKIDGEQYDVKGEGTYNMGSPMREAIVGQDQVHGYKETPQVPSITIALTDRGDLDLKKLQAVNNATIVLELANGKAVVLRSAWFAGEGTVTTGEGEISAKFEGLSAEEV